MGTFISYCGNMTIPPERRAEFNQRVRTILDAGCILDMLGFHYGHTLFVSQRLRENENGVIYGAYCPLDQWICEPFHYRPADCYFSSSQDIYPSRFLRVLYAIYTLYEFYTETPGLTLLDGSVCWTQDILGWFNHLFGTEYTGRLALKDGNGQPVPPVTTLEFLNCSWDDLFWKWTPDGAVPLTPERKDWLQSLQAAISELICSSQEPLLEGDPARVLTDVVWSLEQKHGVDILVPVDFLRCLLGAPKACTSQAVVSYLKKLALSPECSHSVQAFRNCLVALGNPELRKRILPEKERE